MYILIEKERLPQGRHYERMPDGRCIVSGREAKVMGLMDGVTIVPNTTILNELRRKYAAANAEAAGENEVADEISETTVTVETNEEEESK